MCSQFTFTFCLGKKVTHTGHRGQIKCFNYNRRFFQDNIQYFSNGWIPHSSDMSSYTQKCIFIITSTHWDLPLSLITQGQAVVFDCNVWTPALPQKTRLLQKCTTKSCKAQFAPHTFKMLWYPLPKIWRTWPTCSKQPWNCSRAW